MLQLRRLAITAEDPTRLAAFYREVFELDQIREGEGAVFLSDGTFSLALVPGTAGMASGLQGLGFETARVESIRMKLARNADAEHDLVERDARTGIEYEMRDPDGNVVGLCQRAFDVSLRQGPVPIRHIAFTRRTHSASRIFTVRSWI
jgi:catechol 2,3-dioxygenase-like lactoylglutathione lyase family enzyme